MKIYAVLRVRDNTYELRNCNGDMILSDNLPKALAMYELSRVFNILSEKGWDLEHEMNVSSVYSKSEWYMMSTRRL